MNGETPLDEEVGRMLALRLQARQAVAEAQRDGRLGRQLTRDLMLDVDADQRGRKQGTAGQRGPAREQPSEKELLVIGCLSHGLTAPEAAEVLGLCLETVRSRVKRARQVTASKTREQLVAVCLRQGWLL